MISSVDYLSKQFHESYEPSMEVAVDEAMVKFQDQSSMKQYVLGSTCPEKYDSRENKSSKK